MYKFRRACVGLAVLFMASAASADTLTFVHNVQFSDGGTSPVGTSPWVQAVASDAGSKVITIKMETPGLTSTEFLDEFYFNLDTALDLTKLSVMYTSGQQASTILKGQDLYKADGDGLLDLKFLFPTANDDPLTRFIAGEQSTYTLTYTGTETFNVYSLNFLSAPDGPKAMGFPKDGLSSAAHIQSIGPDGDSGWTTGAVNADPNVGGAVPLPAPVFAGAALFGILGVVRRFSGRTLIG